MPLLPSSTLQELGDRQHCFSPVLLTALLSISWRRGRTIRAYSFYVTYCKHTNARTAKPAVWSPALHKIMYNKSNGIRPLRPYQTRLDTPGRHQVFRGRCFGQEQKVVWSTHYAAAPRTCSHRSSMASPGRTRCPECPHFKLCRLSERGKAILIYALRV